jgi:DNA polymerase III epsilon subunit-like protein
MHTVPQILRDEMYIGIDLETQGFDAEKDAPTEIGLVGFNDNFEELWALNFLIQSPLTKPQTKEIEEITGITDAMIAQGESEGSVVEQIYPLLKGSKAIFAYNAPFDNAFLKALLKRQGAPLLDVLIVDVMRDIQYPPRMTCKKLSHLAYDHGIVAPVGSLHRATADVRLMIQLLSKYNLWEMMSNAREPKVTIRIKIPPPWEDKAGNEYAKTQGFRFVPETKFWCKEIRESQLNKIIADSKYPIVRIK